MQESALSEQIIVYDLVGSRKLVKEINSLGNGSITINREELLAGRYLYSLIVDGKEIETLKMVLLD